MGGKKNQVNLTFAGDSDKLEKAFDNVGSAAKDMDGKVSASSKNVGDSFDRAGEAADNVDTKAMGFRDTMTGVEDTGVGLSKIMKGDLFDGFLTLGMGVGDLASGMYNFVIPAIKNMTLGMLRNAVATVKNTAAAAVHKVALIGSAIATKAMTAAQWALNVAMRANPIGIIITVLVALGAAIVLAWKKSETFRNIVRGAMRGIVAAFRWVLDKGRQLWGWFKALPPAIAGAFSIIGSAIAQPFITAFNWIRNAWNSTVGGFGFTVPDWIPIVGGKSFRIPMLHQGGIVPGAPGSETLALLQAGERVTPANQVSREMRTVRVDLGPAITEIIRKQVRAEGGNVQIVLGAG